MTRKRNRGGRAWVLGVCLIIACFAFGAVLANAGTTSGKSKTRVAIKFKESLAKPGVFDYGARVRPRAKCGKKRRVTFFHDENGNGKLDKGEFVIKRGRTNRRGVFTFESRTTPPSGDKIGVVVKANRKCKEGRASKTV